MRIILSINHKKSGFHMANGEEVKYSIPCPACPLRFRVAASKIGPKGSKFRCPRCGSPFMVTIEAGQPVATPLPVEPAVAAPAPKMDISAQAAFEPAPSAGLPSEFSQEPVAPPVAAPAADLAPPPPPALAAATAPAPTAPSGEVLWQVDVPEYRDYTFSMAEIRKLVRDGGLFPADKVARVGEENWVEAGQVSELNRFFELKEMLAKKKPEPQKKGPGGAPASAQRACANHPQWEADYQCSKCGRYLCVHCVEEKQAGSNRYMSCKSCQDLCRKLDKTYAIPPFYKVLPQIFGAPLKGWGPVMVLINALLILIGRLGRFSLYPAVFAIFYLMALAYMLWIVKYAARGRETVPDWPDTSDIFELAKIGGRASMVTLVSFGPMLLFVILYLFTPVFNFMKPDLGEMFSAPMAGSYAPTEEMMAGMPSDESPGMTSPEDGASDQFGSVPDTAWVEQMAERQGAGSREDMSSDAQGQMDERQQREQEARDQAAARAAAGAAGEVIGKGLIFVVIVVVLAILGAIYYPMALAVVAVWNAIRPILSPRLIFRFIGRIAGEYILLLIFTGVFMLIGWILRLGFGMIPYAGFVISVIINVYFGFVTSFMLGRLCYSNDQKLAWEQEIYPGTAAS